MTRQFDETALLAGFANPVLDSQSVFRAVLNAMSFPGRPQTVAVAAPAPPPLDPATIATCLTLLDVDTSVWLDDAGAGQGVQDHLKFHCGCPIVARPETARFAVIAAPEAMPRLAAFDAGDDQYPDRSATLLLQIPSLQGGATVRLSGPGIENGMTLSPAGLPDWFWADWAENGLLFPTGVDIIFTCRTSVVGLPRSIKAEG